MQETSLELLPVQEFHKAAFCAGKAELSSLLGVKLFDRWPTFPEAFASRASQGEAASKTDHTLANEWPGYFFIDRSRGYLVGNGGFFGPPNAERVVEIGYEIAPEMWGRGYATSAVKAMLRYAFSPAQVRAVQAHTLAEKNASNRVLEKVGMLFAGEVPNDEFGIVWRWEIEYKRYVFAA